MNILLATLSNNFMVLNASEQIVTTLQNYIGPFLLIAIAIFAIKFVKDQQFMGLIGFIAIALVVIIIFYTPGVLKTIASSFVTETSIEDSSGTSGP